MYWCVWTYNFKSWIPFHRLMGASWKLCIKIWSKRNNISPAFCVPTNLVTHFIQIRSSRSWYHQSDGFFYFVTLHGLHIGLNTCHVVRIWRQIISLTFTNHLVNAHVCLLIDYDFTWFYRNACLILGIFFILPCVDAYARVDLRTRTYDVPPQEV